MKKNKEFTFIGETVISRLNENKIEVSNEPFHVVITTGIHEKIAFSFNSIKFRDDEGSTGSINFTIKDLSLRAFINDLSGKVASCKAIGYSDYACHPLEYRINNDLKVKFHFVDDREMIISLINLSAAEDEWDIIADAYYYSSLDGEILAHFEELISGLCRAESIINKEAE